MKKILFFIILFVLAGTASFLIFCNDKKEVKKTFRDYASEISYDVGRKKSIHQDVYIGLDDQSIESYKVSNTDIANFINAAIEISPWIKNPNRIYFGKDSIKWNYVRFGIGNRNPTFKVTHDHSMWLQGKEILEYNNYFPYFLSGKVDKEDIELTDSELKEQQKLDSLSSAKKQGVDKNIQGEDNLFIRAFFLAVVFSAFAFIVNDWTYRFDDDVLTKKIP